MAKYLKLLIVVLFTTVNVLLVSCSNDDDDLSIGNSSITSMDKVTSLTKIAAKLILPTMLTIASLA